jgi:fatty acid desaturase
MHVPSSVGPIYRAAITPPQAPALAFFSARRNLTNMDHVAALSRLPDDRKAVLTARSDRAGLSHLALYLGALTCCTAGIVAQVPFWGLLVLPQGVLLSFLFTLSHECTHQTPFRARWLNEACGHAIGAILALPFTWFRYFHLAHHRFTNDPANDPELAGGGRPETWGDYLVYLSGWGFWRGGYGVLISHAAGRVTAPYLPPRKHTAMVREARIILALHGAALISLAWSPLLLWVWIVPAIAGQPVLRAYLLAEHGHCPPVADMLENSRTTFTNRLIRFLAWNMPYHAEHHAFPAVPFHRLPDLHRDLAPHLKSTSPGYGAFTADYARGLRAQPAPVRPAD